MIFRNIHPEPRPGFGAAGATCLANERAMGHLMAYIITAAAIPLEGVES